MGVWGTGVFDSDLAADLRADWRDGVIEAVDLEALTARIVDSLLFAGDEDIFWPALAAAQHETGRLDDAVRDRALAVIAAGVDVDKWEGSASARTRALARLRDKLTGPRVPPKRIRRSRSYGVPLELGDVIALRDDHGAFGALVATAALQPARRAGDAPDPLVVNLVWDAVDPVHDLDLAALDVVWAGRNGRGEPLARCTFVATERRADMLTDQVGVIVGTDAHPYRLPAEYARVAGMPLVQHFDSWPFLYPSARLAGIQGNEPFDITEELISVQEQAGQLVRAYGVGLLLPDQTPEVFVAIDELYPSLRAMLSRHARAGGGILLGLNEPQWRWVVERLDPAHAETLEVLHERHAVVMERRQNLPVS